MAKCELLLMIVILSLAKASVLSGGGASPSNERQARGLLDFIRYGTKCHGCPDIFCDDDPSIIHGYCCGCARFYDNLPVKCSSSLRCPLNTYELCNKYEYMMACCCAKS